jgi:hypothetical protein
MNRVIRCDDSLGETIQGMGHLVRLKQVHHGVNCGVARQIAGAMPPQTIGDDQ